MNRVILVILALASVQSVSAAERMGRLTVEVKVNGQEQWRNAQGTDTATVRIAQTVTVLKLTTPQGSNVPFATTQGNGTATVEMSWRFEEL